MKSIVVLTSVTSLEPSLHLTLISFALNITFKIKAFLGCPELLHLDSFAMSPVLKGFHLLPFLSRRPALMASHLHAFRRLLFLSGLAHWPSNWSAQQNDLKGLLQPDCWAWPESDSVGPGWAFLSSLQVTVMLLVILRMTRLAERIL